MRSALIDRRAILASVLASTAAMPFAAGSARAQGDPLPAWNDSPSKQSILGFVAAATQEGSPEFVPGIEAHCDLRQRRHAMVRTADVRPGLALDRVKALSNQHPEWKEKEPFKAALENDFTCPRPGR